jgi:hypothetical protein|tara:strand:- start:362 stop:481 length:120 start_codon:yes stop_codon:yes gene_type:complete
VKININVEIDTNDERDCDQIEELINVLTDLKKKIEYYED